MRIIDIHTHGFGPHETGSGDPYDIIGMARFHASSGCRRYIADRFCLIDHDYEA